MEKKLGHIIVKAWQDPKFKEKLIKGPRDALEAEGFEITKGVNVTVCENTDSQLFLVIPQKPSEELNEEQLLAIAGGTSDTEDFARLRTPEAAARYQERREYWAKEFNRL